MFRVWFAVAVILLAGQGPVIAKVNEGRPASCLLIVKGQEIIRGECTFTPIDIDGSFQIFSYNGKYFAYVNITKKGVAEGYWNEEPYANHAHSPLGELYREDGCWVNSLASVCAY